jgi:hypothetical protein
MYVLRDKCLITAYGPEASQLHDILKYLRKKLFFVIKCHAIAPRNEQIWISINLAAFMEIDTSLQGPQCKYRYFPEDATYAVLFTCL